MLVLVAATWAAEQWHSPSMVLVQYGAIGVMAIGLAIAVKVLDQRNTKASDARIADRDAIIADKNKTIADKDLMIQRLQDILATQIAPVMTKNAQVLEAMPDKENATLDRLEQILSDVEAKMGAKK